MLRVSADADRIGPELAAGGFDPIVIGLFDLAPPEDMGPLDDALERLSQFDWVIFTSANGVRAVAGRLSPAGQPLSDSVRIVAVGPATADAVRAAGWRVDLTPVESASAGILEELRARTRGRQETVLLPQSALADADLRAGLSAAGFAVTSVVAYRPVERPESIERARHLILAGEVSSVVFTSPSTVRVIAEDFSSESTWPPVVAIGQRTLAESRKCGIPGVQMARSPEPKSVLEALRRIGEGDTP